MAHLLPYTFVFGLVHIWPTVRPETHDEVRAIYRRLCVFRRFSAKDRLVSKRTQKMIDRAVNEPSNDVLTVKIQGKLEE
jgi:hypothetical protein